MFERAKLDRFSEILVRPRLFSPIKNNARQAENLFKNGKEALNYTPCISAPHDLVNGMPHRGECRISLLTRIESSH